MTQKTVVILLSDKRSGSTMFQRELCQHSQIQTVAYSPHTYLETHHWLKGAVLLGLAPETFAGRKVYAGYGSANSARIYLIDCIQRNVPDFQAPADDRSLVFDGWEALCEKFAQPVFFEKSPQLLAHWAALSLLLDWMQHTQFKVKVIGMTRNPLSVQYSALQLFHTPPEKRQYSWLEVQKNMLAFKNLILAEDFFHLKYEDIIENPKNTFAAIFEFIGVPDVPEIGSSVHKESLTKWRHDPFFNLQLDHSVKQMAIRLGYAETDLINPLKPQPLLAYRLQMGWQRAYGLAIARLKDRIFRPLMLWFRWKPNR